MQIDEGRNVPRFGRGCRPVRIRATERTSRQGFDVHLFRFAGSPFELLNARVDESRVAKLCDVDVHEANVCVETRLFVDHTINDDFPHIECDPTGAWIPPCIEVSGDEPGIG